MSYLYFFSCFLISPIFSAFFSSSETALANTTKCDGAVAELKENPQGTLLTILFGNHWSNQLPTMVLSAWSMSLFGWWCWLPMGIHTFYTLYLGEMLAKAYALAKANTVASLTAPFLLPLVKIMGKTLAKLAPETQKTQDELCLEARLNAEMESEVLTLADLLVIHKKEKPSFKNNHRTIKMDSSVSMADAEEYCITVLIAETQRPWLEIGNTWIQVYEDNKIGEKKSLGMLNLGMFYMKDWDHIKKAKIKKNPQDEKYIEQSILNMMNGKMI